MSGYLVKLLLVIVVFVQSESMEESGFNPVYNDTPNPQQMDSSLRWNDLMPSIGSEPAKPKIIENHNGERGCCTSIEGPITKDILT